jgi:hypothetical protein
MLHGLDEPDELALIRYQSCVLSSDLATEEGDRSLLLV